MCSNFNFSCIFFARRSIKSNISAKLENENIKEVAKAEINEVAEPIPEQDPSDVDAPPKGKFEYILVF